MVKGSYGDKPFAHRITGISENSLIEEYKLTRYEYDEHEKIIYSLPDLFSYNELSLTRVFQPSWWDESIVR